MTVRLGTKYLFDRLLKTLKPDLVCDVGSMDASDALRFRRRLPAARIVAFEGNPQNLARLKADPKVANGGILINPRLVWNADGARPFFVEQLKADQVAEDIRQGISSTRPRTVNSLGSRKIEVETVRLDSFVSRLAPAPQRIALWIDVEGAAYEVLEGIAGISEQVVLVHVEVETREFWKGQRLKPEVEALTREMGFIALARGENEGQHDLVLVRNQVLARAPMHCLQPLLVTYFTTNRLRAFAPSRLAELVAASRSGCS